MTFFASTPNLMGVPSDDRFPAVMTRALKPRPMPGFHRTETRMALEGNSRLTSLMRSSCSAASMLTVSPSTANTDRRSARLTLVPVKRIRSAGKPALRAVSTSHGDTASIQAPRPRRSRRIPRWGLAFMA